MKVRCIANTGKDLPENYLEMKWQTLTRETEFNDLTVGKEYVVYAMEIKDDGQIRYAIVSDVHILMPLFYAAPLFEVVDGRPSEYWRFALNPDEHIVGTFAFEEWVSDPDFYWNLVEGERKEVSIFRKMKRLMDEPYRALELYERVVLLTDRFREDDVLTGDIGYVVQIMDDDLYEVEFATEQESTKAIIVAHRDEIVSRESK